MIWQVIDFYKLLQLLLPTFLRKPKLILFLGCTVKPLDLIYTDTLYKMQHNCQVIYLEKILNEYFDAVGYDTNNHEGTKQIKIIDEIFPPENYIYLEGENRPSLEYDNTDLWLDDDEIFLEDDLPHFDFVILIPIAYSFVEQKLRAVIDYYKLAGKNYRIQLY
jgi:hypothetical protein